MSDDLSIKAFEQFPNFKGICYEFSTAKAYGRTRWHGFLHFVNGKCVSLSHVGSVQELEAEAIHLLRADVIEKLDEHILESVARKQKLIDELMLLDSDISSLMQSLRTLKNREGANER